MDGDPLILNLTIAYNEMAQYWVMSIDDEDGNSLLSNIPLLTGFFPAANILGQYVYLQIGSAYVLDMSNSVPIDYPNASDLGSDFVLLWGDNV